MTKLLSPLALLAVAIATAIAPALLGGQNVSPPAGDAGSNAAEAKRLIAVVRSDAATFDKARACQQLAVLGDKEAVPALAALLADEKLAAHARSGLESIADPSADDALRQSLDKLHGELLAGAINSIGVRRDAKAVPALSRLARDRASGVADEALAALGRIASPKAIEAVRQSLKADTAEARVAAAHACLTAAERLLSEAKQAEAAALYDAVRQAEVPKHVRAAATQGAILARGDAALPLLVEQLKSGDAAAVAAAIRASRRMAGSDVTRAILAELGNLPPARQALALGALGDRRDAAALPAVRKAAAEGPIEVRLTAIQVLGQLNDAASAAMLLDVSVAAQPDLVQAARTSLATLQGDVVDSAIVARLDQGSTKDRLVLLGIVGQRRIRAATPAVLKAADSPDAELRHAAVRTLGRIIGAENLPVLTGRLLAAKTPEETAAAQEALTAACLRITDRDACATQLAASIPQAPVPAKCFLLEVMGRMGGAAALKTVAAHARGDSAETQDTATRVLGNWMSVDAAPELLDLAKTLRDEKLRTRTLRGYIRIARQLDFTPDQRLAMCEEALKAAQRDEEKKLALDVLGRVASAKSLAVAARCLSDRALKEDAAGVAIAIAEKIVRAEPRAVAEAMQQVLRAGVSAEKSARAKAILTQAKPERT